MVDPTKSIGTVLGLQAQGKPQAPKNNRREDAQKTEPRRDEVTLSAQALNLSQAEDTARKIRDALEDSDTSLGFDPKKFDETV